ncbi:MAG: sialate O-acetylesterase [bacterium]|nr:sialate O-acetylesterase [bacterium]
MATSAYAEIELPTLIGDHMVLQQGQPVKLWGKAAPDTKVKVELAGMTGKGKSGANGVWWITMPPMKAGGPYTMAITAGNSTHRVNDVLIGEVWVCSGQSNMAMVVKSCDNAEVEIAAADFPRIRLFKVPPIVADKPQTACPGQWQICSPETIPTFSGAGYFFGRTIHKTLDVPVGLISSSWGGTPAEAWTSHKTLLKDPDFKPILDRWERVVYEYPKKMERYEFNLAEWERKAKRAKEAGKDAPKKPVPPMGPDHKNRASNLYNAMIHPLTNYAIRGAIWYQGESNAGRAYQYRALFPAMIEDWRAAWDMGRWSWWDGEGFPFHEDGAFPFYFVQLANFRDQQPEPGDSAWAELREAQSMTLSLKNTGTAVIIDVGDAKDIHPKNKQDVGQRLARNALAKTYGKNVAWSGPVLKGMKRRKGELVLTFDHVEDGLVAKDGPLKGFAIAGEDKTFVWADARIDGNRVVLSASAVSKPVAVRYAWADNPDCNLYNSAGLPASPFRTDEWPGVTAKAK